MLTDEEIQEIRNRAKLNDNRQIDPMAFARDIERAVLAKAWEQEPIYMWQMNRDDGWIVCTKAWFDDVKNTNATRIVYAHPLPAQAIPEGWREVVEAVAHIGIDFGYGAFELSQEHIDKARELLSASQKP